MNLRFVLAPARTACTVSRLPSAQSVAKGGTVPQHEAPKIGKERKREIALFHERLDGNGQSAVWAQLCGHIVLNAFPLNFVHSCLLPRGSNGSNPALPRQRDQVHGSFSPFIVSPLPSGGDAVPVVDH